MTHESLVNNSDVITFIMRGGLRSESLKFLDTNDDGIRLGNLEPIVFAVYLYETSSPGQLLTKVMNDELTALMGGEVTDLDLKNNPTIILIAGLNGAGKTTFTGKLANFLKSKGKKPLLVAGDVYRPAAVDQLQILGEQIGVPVYANTASKDPVGIAMEGIAEGKAQDMMQTAALLGFDTKIK